MVKVFGHISPDTDATCSAIIWSWYLNTHTTHDAVPYVLGELNKETQFVLSHWKQAQPEVLGELTKSDKIVIVDTNNPQELPPNIAETDIMQIIDHHKLVGGLETKGPIDITLRPFASTASVIYSLLGEHADALPDDIAGLLLSCIISDTLAFRSPTTTPHDKYIAETLAQNLAIDIVTYADQMFTAKSDISDFTDHGLINIDSKKYAVGDKNFRVSVVETTRPNDILDRQAGIIKAIETIKKEEDDIDDILFFIIDIFKEEATVLTYNQLTKDIIETSFGVTITNDETVVLPGIVSRKKQILPALACK